MTTETILRLDCVSKHFGGLNVVEDLSFSVQRGWRTALIGPNGAGKTTVFNLISGVSSLDTGVIYLDGLAITQVPSRLRIRHGVARTFQNVRLMPHLSTLENVLVGQHWRYGGWRGILHPVNLIPGNRWREEARAALAGAGGFLNTPTLRSAAFHMACRNALRSFGRLWLGLRFCSSTSRRRALIRPRPRRCRFILNNSASIGGLLFW